jgi:hypothetical protein
MPMFVEQLDVEVMPPPPSNVRDDEQAPATDVLRQIAQVLAERDHEERMSVE